MRRLLTAVPLALLLVLLPLLALAASPGREALDRGSRLYKQRRYAEAIAAFQEATRLDPGLLAGWENLGFAYHRAGRHAEAVETWGTLLKVDPKRVEVLNAMAAIQLSEERWERAVETLSRSLSAAPDQPSVRLRLASAHEKLGQLPLAETQYRELARLQPADLGATLKLAGFYERTSRDGEALACLRQALQRHPRFGAVLRYRLARLQARRGDEAYARGDYRAARAAYAEAVQGDPRSPQYLVNLGWSHRQLGDRAEATRAWKQALAVDPERGSLYRHLADAALEQEDYREAATLYSEAWEKAERAPGIPYRLAEIALLDGALEQALEWIEQLLDLPEGDAEWSRRAASLLVRFERADAGLALFERRRTASRAPGETRAALARLHAARGSTAYQAGDLPAAIRDLSEAVRLDPQSPEALRELGWAHFASEDWAACADTWKRYAAAFPDRTQPLNLLTQLHLKRKDHAAAVETARASLRLEPDQTEQALKLAKALFWAGRFPESKRLAERLAQQQPDDLATQLFLAEMLMQYHDFQRGEAQWRRVLDLGYRSAKAEYYWVQSLYEQGRYDEALSQARRLLDEEGPRQPLLQFLAQDAALRQRPEAALHWYGLLAQHFPDRVEAALELARLQERSGDLEAARATLREARRRHPDRLDVALAQAQVERRLGSPAEAYAAFRDLGRRYPAQREIFWARLDTALEAGKPGEALEALAASRAPFLKGYEVRMQRARILLAMGDDSGALRSLQPLLAPSREVAYVPVLLYHGLGDHPRSPMLPVALFESQMARLRREGYTAISVGQLARMADGKEPFPARPVLITFDDARRDSFELGDPVLARHGLKATMFVPTARTLDEHPFFADWKTIAGFAGNGRWELQSHGHRAHDLIAVDAEQQELGSFLVNREWLPDERRLETDDEYAARLDADHRRSVEEIESRSPGARVVGYAFPFSEAGQESAGNAPRAAELNQELLAKRFRFGFVQDSSGYNELGRSDAPQLLRRMAIPRQWDGDALMKHLSEQHPHALALAQRARMQYWKGRYDEARRDFGQLTAAYPALAGEAAYYLAAIAYQRGEYDAAQRQLATAEQAGTPRLQRDDALPRRIAWEKRTRLQPRAQASSDSDGRDAQTQALDLRPGFLGPLDLTLGIGRLVLGEQGWGTLASRELVAAARVSVPHWTFETRAWQRTAERGTAPDTFSFRGGVRFESDTLTLALRAGQEDVDTLRARQAGLQTDTVAAHAELHPSERWSLGGDAIGSRFDDGNERRDLSGRLLFHPRGVPGLGLGVALGTSDTSFSSDLYYAPERLRWARGMLSYRLRWGAGWMVEAELGLGRARDDLRGDRGTIHFGARAGQAWADRFRTLFEGRYSSSPGYETWGLGATLQLGF